MQTTEAAFATAAKFLLILENRLGALLNVTVRLHPVEQPTARPHDCVGLRNAHTAMPPRRSHHNVPRDTALPENTSPVRPRLRRVWLV